MACLQSMQNKDRSSCVGSRRTFRSGKHQPTLKAETSLYLGTQATCSHAGFLFGSFGILQRTIRRYTQLAHGVGEPSDDSHWLSKHLNVSTYFYIKLVNTWWNCCSLKCNGSSSHSMLTTSAINMASSGPRKASTALCCNNYVMPVQEKGFSKTSRTQLTASVV
jgi:hypothetical protein